ncbi:MAG: type IV secretion system DNA-binding domain-containing protein [Dehalococcoidia bacterium]|nr:type IV secretion system DNA-binding domain-containing protein [Dehalococcoidia bacterium]
MRFRHAEPRVNLVELIPSHWDDEPILRSRAMLGGLAGDDTISLEFVAKAGDLRFYVRSLSGDATDAALDQLRASYPQTNVRWLDLTDRPYLDHSRSGPGEMHRCLSLRLSRDPAFPLATDPRRGDPFKAVLAAASAVRPGERLVSQLVLSPVAGGWSDCVRNRAEAQARKQKLEGRDASSGSILPVLGLLGLAAAGTQGYEWYQQGQTLLLVGSGAGALVGLPLAATLRVRLFGSAESPALDLTNEKLAYPAFAAELRLLAFGPEGSSRKRLLSLVQRVASAYAAFEHPQGNSLRPKVLRATPEAISAPRGPLHRNDILNAAEAAALWHLPDTTAGIAVPADASAHRLLPSEDEVGRGCPVGIAAHQSKQVPVHMPASLLYRNQLIVAKTRRGKSTLLIHQATYLMKRMAEERERLLLVVVDPHQDLAEAVLSQVPSGLEDRVTYLNLADRERPIGLNLLDVGLFPDRDRTAENVITMMHRLWPDNWGPRMEQALRSSLMCLHESNHSRTSEDQYTLLDVLPMLSNESFRGEVMTKVTDSALSVSWRDNYVNLGRVLQQQIANPVTTKIGRFLVNESTRFVIGQPRSSWDPRPLLRDGGVLVVNSAVGVLGEGAAALIGATVLNLLGLLIEEQVSLPPSQRTKVVSLVDESSTLGAADYPRMLSELGKYGASFVLVTQSLAKLDAIDEALRPTVFANIDGLTVFQVSAQDARYLVPELGGDLDVADLTSLDDFECYARWWSQGHRLPTFSLRLSRPPSPRPDKLAAIADRSAQQFGRERAEVAEIIRTILEKREPPPKPGRGATASKPGEKPLGPATTAAQPANQNGSIDRKKAKVQGASARSDHRDERVRT